MTGVSDALKLPIDDVVDDVRTVLMHEPSLVVVAPPGAGKTTRLPLVCINEPWCADRKIVLVEPRRLAARAAAERMADMLGERVGETIGVRARMDTRVGPGTRVEVVTDGVFTRMILDDPTLEGVAAVIFDEFHERALEADFGLALALDVQAGLREDLKLIVMSATLDGARIAGKLPSGRVVESAGRSFPVKTIYVGRARERRLEEHVAAIVFRALDHHDGDVLVFLPGQRDIERACDAISDRMLESEAVDVFPLYGGLPFADQKRAISPRPESARRRVIVSTAIAESSLTIEGVRVVVDAGRSRVPRYDASCGLSRLETVRASRASADQRRGRAGRTAPGVCYRLWDEPETRALPAFDDPEILSTDLTGLVLDCAEWGVTDP
ncbi:MAG: helicase-related protein, partial [Pseudomonadota bacterium]